MKPISSRKRIFISVAVFLIVFLVGMTGFKIFGGKDWSFVDSLYMTVITLSTVGYGEVKDISANPGARIFASVFILVCLGTIAFVVSSVTSFIVEGEMKNLLGRRRMEKEISKLKNHFIICGTDETAQTVIQELIQTKKDFVVIEALKEKIDKLSSSIKGLFVHGDPTEDNILISAGIKRARGIFLSLPTDEANLFITMTARSLNPDIRIVTKGIDVKSHSKIVKAGSDAVVSPAFIGGMRMVSEMIRPAVVTFLDMMLRERKKVLRVEEVTIKKSAPLAGKSIEETKISEKTGALLVAVSRSGSKDYEFNPPKEKVLKEDDILILMASPESVKQVEKLAGWD